MSTWALIIPTSHPTNSTQTHTYSCTCLYTVCLQVQPTASTKPLLSYWQFTTKLPQLSSVHLQNHISKLDPKRLVSLDGRRDWKCTNRQTMFTAHNVAVFGYRTYWTRPGSRSWRADWIGLDRPSQSSICSTHFRKCGTSNEVCNWQFMHTLYCMSMQLWAALIRLRQNKECKVTVLEWFHTPCAVFQGWWRTAACAFSNPWSWLLSLQNLSTRMEGEREGEWEGEKGGEWVEDPWSFTIKSYKACSRWSETETNWTKTTWPQHSTMSTHQVHRCTSPHNNPYLDNPSHDLSTKSKQSAVNKLKSWCYM